MKDNIKSVINYNEVLETDSWNSIKMFKINAGKAILPTGKIVVGDPFLIYRKKPLKKSILPGEYDIELSFIDHPTAGKRVAFARLIINHDKAKYWELALMGEEDLESVKEGEFFGFPVDAGLACFVDYQTCEEFNQAMDKLEERIKNSNYYDDVLAAEFKDNCFDKEDPKDIGDWVNHRFDPEKNQNIVIFSSGFGDGIYPVYWGVDENEQLTSLLIDFLTLDLE
ncbi:MAG: DUF4241 domain-containing protein [Candidatus Lokiarchaeota archaeon]|nr:DUF4241 domain-containing protein [Candidatus Lokiarchaeota archaeon]